MHEVNSSIIKTLCYSDIFEFPLTQNEIVEQLISPKRISGASIKTHLSKLHLDGVICQTGPYFHLPGKTRFAALRAKKTKVSQGKQKKALEIATKMMDLPYTAAVFLTGTVAVNNASADDDLDVLVISAASRLWTCRLFVNMWLSIKGLRRHPNDSDAIDKMCPNLFLDVQALQVPKKQQNLYTAHEVIQAKPLADPHHLYQRFLSDNAWINEYLPNVEIVASEAHVTKHQEAASIGESCVRTLQFWYMRRHQTREIVTHHSAYFHPKDTAGIVLEKYEKRCRNYLAG